MKKFSVPLFALFLFFVCESAFCEHISFSADSMSGTIGDKSDATTLSGEAAVITESMEIYADEIKMSGKDFRYIEATGSVKGINNESQLDFTCGKLKYDRETKVADLSENVSLKDVKNNVEANAQIIQYNQNTDVAVMQISIELKQKDNVCNGVYAVYRKKEQILELSGNAQIKQGDDTFRAQEITLNLDTQEITLDGRVKGSIVDERKSENKDENAESVKTADSGSGDKTAENGAAGEKSDGNSDGSSSGGSAENAAGKSDGSAAENAAGSASGETTSSDSTKDTASKDKKSSSSKKGKK